MFQLITVISERCDAEECPSISQVEAIVLRKKEIVRVIKSYNLREIKYWSDDEPYRYDDTKSQLMNKIDRYLYNFRCPTVEVSHSLPRHLEEKDVDLLISARVFYTQYFENPRHVEKKKYSYTAIHILTELGRKIDYTLVITPRMLNSEVPNLCDLMDRKKIYKGPILYQDTSDTDDGYSYRIIRYIRDRGCQCDKLNVTQFIIRDVEYTRRPLIAPGVRCQRNGHLHGIEFELRWPFVAERGGAVPLPNLWERLRKLFLFF